MNLQKLSPLLLPLLISCAYVSDEEPSPVAYSYSGIVINEVLSHNVNGISDEFGKREDWIELKNCGDTAVQLEGFYLSDNVDNRIKWFIGDTLLAPGEYLMVYASGRDISYPDPTPVSIPLEIAYAGGWSDGSDDLGGKSWVVPYKSTEIVDFTGASPKVSAAIFLGDNAGTLGWQSSSLTVELNGLGNIDLKSYNSFEFDGYFSESKNVHVSVTQGIWTDALKYYGGNDQLFNGNGDGTYRVQYNLSTVDSTIELDNSSALVFRNYSVNDTLNLVLEGIRLAHSGYGYHSSFKLSSSGDVLYLSNSDQEIIDTLAIPALNDDISFGRTNTGSTVLYSVPTPGEENHTEHFTSVVEDIECVTRGGFYSDSIYVELDNSAGDELYYTLDGSIPDQLSERYNSPILIKETSTLRVISLRNGSLSSHITTETFFIDEECSLPVVSLTVDPDALFNPETGLYMKGDRASSTFPYFGANFWDKERVENGHVAFFETEGNEVFSHNIGVKIHGGYSRGEDQKSLALMFDTQGEGWLNYPIFPNYPELQQFKSIMLRAGGQHSRDIAQYDGFNSLLTKGRGVDYQKMRPTVVFINGEYWGLYNIREKLTENFFTTNYGIDGDEINLVKDGGIIQSGSAAEYIKLEKFVNVTDMTNSDNYEYVKSQMDVHNYIDYLSAEIFIVNQDWPYNNIKWWKQRVAGSKWRWVLYDTDGAEVGDASISSDMVGFIYNENSEDNDENHVVLFRKMIANDEFKSDFVNRLLTLLNTNFSPEVYRSTLKTVMNSVENEYERSFSRWGYDKSGWKYKTDQMMDYPETRAEHIREHLNDHFEAGTPVQFSVSASNGVLAINGMTLNSSDFTGIYLDKTPITLSLSNADGFVQWSDGNRDTVRVISVTDGLSIEAEFDR